MNPIFSDVFYYINQFIFRYVIFVDLFYILLIILSIKQIRMFMKRVQTKEHRDIGTSQMTPPVSIIVPAYNEEMTIKESLLSFLNILYPEFEVIVVNDGSKDNTLQVLIDNYSLVEMNVPIREQLQTQTVRKVYRSILYPQLLVLDKENGGKADALNAGINVSSYPYFCSVDADSIIEREALLETMHPFLEGEDDIIASGGIIRIVNGSTVRNGRVTEVGLPRNPIVVHQIIEYLRSFLLGRLGFSGMNSLLIISGAFGIFRKKEILQINGYDTKTVGEDMELVIRLQRFLYDTNSKSKVIFLPNPICWTEAPSTLRTLYRQRIRWNLGLFQSLYKHKRILFNPKYRVLGLIAFPYFVIVELLGPTIELLGLMLVAFGLYFDLVNLSFAIIFLFVTFLFGTFLSMCAILLEEMSFRKYTRVRDFIKLMVYSVFESFWYRQVNAFWKTLVFFMLPFKKIEWGNMERKGFQNENRK